MRFHPIEHEVSFELELEKAAHGNGHMVMIEKNNLQIAGLLADWLSHTVMGH